MVNILSMVVEDVTPTSPDAAFDIDVSAQFGVKTPKFAIFVGCRANGLTDGVMFTVGVTDGTNALCGCFAEKDNVGSGFGQGFTGWHSNSNAVMEIMDPDDRSIDLVCDIVSFSAGNVRVNFSSTPGTSYPFGVLVAGGDDMPNVLVGKTGSLAAGLNEITVGFALNFLMTFMFGPADNNFDTAVGGTSAYFGIGFANNVDETFTFDRLSRTALFAGEHAYGQLRDDRLFIGRNSVGLPSNDHIFLTEFGATSFTVNNTRTFTQEFGFLAVETNGVLLKAFLNQIPTSPQVQSVTVPGFVTGVGLVIQTAITTLNTNLDDSAQIYGMGISMFDRDGNQFGVSTAGSASDPTDVEHDAQSHAVYGGVLGDATAIIGDFDAQTADGFDIDYTKVPGSAVYQIILAIIENEEEAASEVSGESEGDGTWEDTVWDVTFEPRATGIIACAAPVSGPPGLAGVDDVEETGNGFWRLVLSGLPIRTNAQVKHWRAFEAKMTGRIGVANVTFCDGKRAPWPADMSAIDIRASGDFLPEATEGFIEVFNGSEPRAGMDFSTGNRIYRLQEVGNASGDIYPVTIWPKVRELIEDGASLDFVNLTLRSRLENADAMHLMLDVLRFGDPSLTFVEDVLP